MMLKPSPIVRICLSLLAVAVPWQLSFSAEQLPIRTGLWVTQKMPENSEQLHAFEAAVRANPHLSGICLHTGWKDLEKEPGKYDFSQIDNTAAVLKQLGMKYELGIKPGADTPAWVFREGAQSLQTEVTNPHRANYGQDVSVPIPWDGIYQRHFSQLIARLGERYSADPLCVSVVLTCANFMGMEMHLPKRPQDRARWEAAGNYEEKLLQVYSKYTDEWTKAFPRQQISLHISKVLDLPPSFNERVIEYGLSKQPERFTIQNCQLSGRREDTGTLSYDLVLKYGDRAHHGFQSLAAFLHGGERMGSMEMAVLNVVHARGEYWELWNGDGLDPATSAAVEKAWQEAKEMGYEAYKQKLIASGAYQERSDDHYREKVRRGKGARLSGR
jgi:hypothetical protein